jgi:YD repeat-containing protein
MGTPFRAVALGVLVLLSGGAAAQVAGTVPGWFAANRQGFFGPTLFPTAEAVCAAESTPSAQLTASDPTLFVIYGGGWDYRCRGPVTQFVPDGVYGSADGGIQCPPNAFLVPPLGCICINATTMGSDGESCVTTPTPDPKNLGRTCPCTDNPVAIGIGNKFQVETDYAGAGVRPLQLQRVYNGTLVQKGAFGTRWRTFFDRSIAPSNTQSRRAVAAHRPDGKIYIFVLANGQYTPDGDVADRLTSFTSSTGGLGGYRYVTADGEETELYNGGGRLLSITSRTGLTLSFTYDALNRVTSMVDPFGRQLTFTYDAGNRIATMTDPAGGLYQYAYDASGNLLSATYPGGAARTYAYNEPANTSGANLPNALTGIVDENGARFATYKYDATGRAISTEHAGGAERTTLSYGAGTTSVTDALGVQRTYGFQTVLGVAKNTTLVQPAGGGAGTATSNTAYDAQGNVASRTDLNGNRTNFTYDLARNLETARTEGLTSGGGTTPQTRTISTQWHPVLRLPVAVAEPLRITSYTYNGDGGAQCGLKADGTTPVPGVPCSKTVQATTDATGAAGFGAAATGLPRRSTYTYNPNGSILSVDGPRTDVADVTTYTYYANDDADAGRRGNVASVTNALGHVTSITAYNAHGQPATVIDPDGLTTTLAYDARQRLASRSVGGETTTYDYDAVGQLVRVTLPDGSFLRYVYDAAHRLAEMSDVQGNRIAYTLDALGNRIREDVFDSLGGLAQTRSRVFDSLSRLAQEIGAARQTTSYAYDNQGNVVSVTDPLARVTSNQYDALNRLAQVTDPGTGVTRYGYNGIDQLVSVTDPRNLATTYGYDGLGNLNSQLSPDTGGTANGYDAAGNLLTQTDAKGQVTTYTYDALNRVTSIIFDDGSRHAYAYDQGANGIGRLSHITETDAGQLVTGTTAYAYDPHGRVTQETRTIAGVAYATAYQYDAAGRLVGTTYPSGRQVAFNFDSLGRILEVWSAPAGGTAQALATNVAYQPFGGVKSYTLGNGRAVVRGYDPDGRIASYTLGPQTFAIGYDAASRVSFISDAGNPASANTYGYDALDRLTNAVIPNNQYSYVYDAVGNRTAKTVGSATDTYAYSPASNRIAGIAAPAGAVRSFVFDPNGSTTSDGVNRYAYDARGRMVQSVGALGTTTYQVNALGQRVRKTGTSDDRVFLYDAKGRLIAESDAGGETKREYLYLGDIPLAVVQ